MFKFIIFFFLLGLFVFLTLGVLLGRVIRFFAPEKKAKSKRRKTTRQSSYSDDQNKPQKKFSENEGEYVNYEEVKD